MNIKFFNKWFFFLPVLLLCLTSCGDDDNTSDLGGVTNVEWTPTSGGAIITYTAPKSNELLYVKAVYVNSLGNEVYNVSSTYGSTIEIEGLADESKDYPVHMHAVYKDGSQSPANTILVKPGRSYINQIYDNLTITEIVGGVEVRWVNPAGSDTDGKVVFVEVSYHKVGDEDNVQTRYLNSKQENVKLRIRGLKPGDYMFTYRVEDFSGNKSIESEAVTLTAREEIEVPKYIEDENGYRTDIWKIEASQTTLKEVHEFKNAAIFDGVIDTKESAADNSYAGTNRGQYGGSFPWGTDQLDIVIDLNNTVVLSRIKAWQRAHWYGWSEYAESWKTDGTSDDYYYYQPGNLKSFSFYGSLDGTPGSWFLVEDCDIEKLNDLKWGIRDDWYNCNWNMPLKESYDAALAGHEWELDKMSDPLRFIRIRFTSNWDRSNADCCGMSELTLFGAYYEE